MWQISVCCDMCRCHGYCKYVNFEPDLNTNICRIEEAEKVEGPKSAALLNNVCALENSHTRVLVLFEIFTTLKKKQYQETAKRISIYGYHFQNTKTYTL